MMQIFSLFRRPPIIRHSSSFGRRTVVDNRRAMPSKQKPALLSATMILLFALLGSFFAVHAQPADSVDVTFYYLPDGNPSVVYLPGEFNNWGLPYVNGRIVRSDVAMQKDPATGIWWKTVRLRVGGHPGGGIPGAYQYKFNENGDRWLSDPRNPRRNPREYNNSYLYITDPTIHYLLPNSLSAVVKTRQPEITAYVFPAVGSAVEESSITVILDGRKYSYPGSGYDHTTRQFTFTVPEPLPNGEHTLILQARSTRGTPRRRYHHLHHPGRSRPVADAVQSALSAR